MVATLPLTGTKKQILKSAVARKTVSESALVLLIPTVCNSPENLSTEIFSLGGWYQRVITCRRGRTERYEEHAHISSVLFAGIRFFYRKSFHFRFNYFGKAFANCTIARYTNTEYMYDNVRRASRRNRRKRKEKCLKAACGDCFWNRSPKYLFPV